jgi:hypothetical protein
MLGRSRRDFES